MKFTALILLSSFITYFTETIELPYKIFESSKKTMCCSKAMKSTCTKTNKKEESKKSESNNCNSTSACTNCPLTYTMVLDNPGNDEATIALSKAKYNLTQSHFISDYISKQWKSPNIG